MKRVLITGLAAAIFSIATSAQSKETRNVDSFSRVSFGIAGELYVDFGSGYKLTLEGEKDDLDEILTEVKDGRLVIRHENSNWSWPDRRKVVVYLTMPEIEGLSVSGSGKARINDDIVNAEEISFSVSGSGNVYVGNITAGEISCGISGSGNVVIEGKGEAREGEISISGSGNYTGESFVIQDLSVRISGSGNSTVNAGKKLEASVSGSGNVSYIGNPVIDARVSGSGKVRSR